MNDSIRVQISNGEDKSDVKEYSILQYAQFVLSNEEMGEYHQLVREMLNYGAAAQNYFNYNCENLVNAGISGVGAQEIPTYEDKAVSIDGELDGIEIYGATVVCREKIALRYYFRISDQSKNYTFAVGDKVVTPFYKNGLYCVEVAQVFPQDLDQQVIITVTDGTGCNMTVGYSPLNYIVRMNKKGGDSLKMLLRALYNYHLEAKAFISSN